MIKIIKIIIFVCITIYAVKAQLNLDFVHNSVKTIVSYFWTNDPNFFVITFYRYAWSIIGLGPFLILYGLGNISPKSDARTSSGYKDNAVPSFFWGLFFLIIGGVLIYSGGQILLQYFDINIGIYKNYVAQPSFTFFWF